MARFGLGPGRAVAHMSRKHYTDEQVAAALDRLRWNKGNYLETSKETGIARATLRNWNSGKLPPHAQGQVISSRLDSGKSAQIADQLEEMTPEMLTAARALIPVTKFKDLLEGANLAISNAQLLRGGPTKRQETNIRVSLTGGLGLRELSAQVIEGQYTALPDLPVSVADTIPQRQAEPE